MGPEFGIIQSYASSVDKEFTYVSLHFISCALYLNISSYLIYISV